MKNHVLPLVIALCIISSCSTSSMRPDVVDRSTAQKAQSVVFGVIEDVTRVTIEGDRELGALTGGVIGGAIGKSNSDEEIESGVGAILGSLIGSKVGAEIGSSATKMEGVELLILKDSGKYISIVQEAADFNFQAGQTVKIVMSGGKSRVLPR
jgi:outer membrane lipoprotein SlyB